MTSNALEKNPHYRTREQDSPKIEPLRISKPATPTPPRAAGVSSSRTYDCPPPKQLFRQISRSGGPAVYNEEDSSHSRSQADSRADGPSLAISSDEKLARRHKVPPSTRTDAFGSPNRRPLVAETETSYDTAPMLTVSPMHQKGPGLAARRGNVPKPLPESSGPEVPDKEGEFPPQDTATPVEHRSINTVPNGDFDDGYRVVNANVGLVEPIPGGVNRFSSTTSVSTTKGNRGSPAPPETPVLGLRELNVGELRYPSSGVIRTRDTTAASRSQSFAPTISLPVSPGPAVMQQRQTKPWTPTEIMEHRVHGSPAVYQGQQQISSPLLPGQRRAGPSPPAAANTAPRNIDQDMTRMRVTGDPPPAYSRSFMAKVNGGMSYPKEKPRTETADQTGRQPLESPALIHPGHPAFANDRPLGSPGLSVNNTPVQQFARAEEPQSSTDPISPPPLPEGWIANLDQTSGQYYYIHLPTQSTQWEFPAGPLPLNHENAPLSPGSTYCSLASPARSTYSMASPGVGTFGKGQSLRSPLFPPHTPGYADSIMSLSSQAPTLVGFSGPPPGAGVAMYKVAPTNGVYFGPYLKYINMNLEHGIWLGSVMLVTDNSQPPTIHIHKSTDLSPNPRQLTAINIHTHQRWLFWRYDIDLQMEDGAGDKWTYAITSHLGCTRYEFVVAGRYDTTWRFIAHSGNDFSTSTSQTERSKLGGISPLWKDVLQKNIECSGFHVQIGLGGQISGDRLWKELPILKQWLAVSGRENRRVAGWTAKCEEDVTHAYFHYYTSHFDQPFLREAFAQIPGVLNLGDHDIFDGFGSYPDHVQNSSMFKNIGRIAIESYLLFQHHTTLEILRNVSTDADLFTITGTGWHSIRYLGPSVVVIGADVRSERSMQQVMAGPTYQGLFPKVAMLPANVQHCIWLMGVPLVYPRLEGVESAAKTIATGKKAVNSTYNLLGKITSGVAGVVGGKEIVASGFGAVKKAVGKDGLMGSVLNNFGDLGGLDELRDMWTHDSKDLERTYVVRTLQSIALQKGIRMTFLCGAVNSASAGLFHDPTHPSDHKTMYQITTSSIVSAPPPPYILKLFSPTLQKPLYVPQNGHKSSSTLVSETKEEMMEIFQLDGVVGRETRRLMGRRNFVAVVAFDPEVAQGVASSSYGGSTYGGSGGSMHSGSQEVTRRLSLAVDFFAQAEGTFGSTSKYGPVIIPCLEFGR